MDTVADYVNSIRSDLKKLPKDLEDEIQSLNLKMDKQFEFAKEDMQLRIESLKAQLDKVRASYEKTWEESTENIKESIFTELNIEELIQEIEQIDEKIKTDGTVTEKIENMQQLSKKFNEKLDSIRKVKLDITFRVNSSFDEILNDEKAIGELHWVLSDSCCCKAPFRIFEKFEPRIMKVDNSPSEIIQLPDKRYLARYESPKNNLLILDSNLNYVKAFPSQSYFSSYKALSMTCDSNHIYIAFESSLVKYNYDFKIVEEKDHSGLDNLCIYEDQLYSCCNSNIELFATDLNHIGTFQCKQPDQHLKLRIIKGCAFVSCLNSDFEHVFRIYSLPYFLLIEQYRMRVSAMEIYKDYLFVYFGSRLFLFNSNGSCYTFTRFPLRDVKDMITADDHLIICSSKPDGFIIAKIN